LGIVTWLLYGVTFVFTIISLISTAFPALILRMIGGFEDYAGINPFEPGHYFVPLISANLAILCLGILYHKEKLPKLVTRSIKFIFNFELNTSVTIFIIILMIGIYLIFTVEELFNGEYFDDYYIRAQERLETYDPMVIGEYGLGKHFGIFFDWAGLQIFWSRQGVSSYCKCFFGCYNLFINSSNRKKKVCRNSSNGNYDFKWTIQIL